MAGSKVGGLKAAATNKERHGDDFYARIGAKGGRNGHTGGFASNIERAKIAGAKGGRASRRNDAKDWWELNKEKVETMIKHGYTLGAIGKKLGKTQSQIGYVVNKYGEK